MLNVISTLLKQGENTRAKDNKGISVEQYIKENNTLDKITKFESNKTYFDFSSNNKTSSSTFWKPQPENNSNPNNTAPTSLALTNTNTTLNPFNS